MGVSNLDKQRKETPLYRTISDGLRKYRFDEKDMDLIYTCFVAINAGAKYLPGYRLIYLVYKMSTLLMAKGQNKNIHRS